MSINRKDPLNVLIFNFDENRTNTNIYKLLDNINQENPNIIFITTQNSKSRTDKHMQHIISNFLPKIYKRFSKVDATRQSDLKKIMYRNLKNVRTRIYYNTKTVYIDKVFDRFKNQSSTKSIFTFSNNNIDENNQKYIIKKTNEIPNNNPIIIKEYKYKRYTVEGDNGRAGLGGIMTSIVFKMGDLDYQYIVCNYNFNFKNSNLKQKFSKIIQDQNIILKSSNNNQLPIIFIYFVTINNHLYYHKYFSDYKNKIINGSINNIIQLNKGNTTITQSISENEIRNKNKSISISSSILGNNNIRTSYSEVKNKPISISNSNVLSILYNKNLNSAISRSSNIENSDRTSFSVNKYDIIQSRYKQKVFEYMYKKFKEINDIPNIPEHIIQLAIERAIENKKLNYTNNGQQIIRISCPVCDFGMNLEKACGITRCCNTGNQITIEKLCNKIITDRLEHCLEKKCKELRQTYPKACLTPLLILTIDYQQHKNINLCFSTLPYYF
jgi:hypothetical protein